jgi:hypothetical protein
MEDGGKEERESKEEEQRGKPVRKRGPTWADKARGAVSTSTSLLEGALIPPRTRHGGRKESGGTSGTGTSDELRFQRQEVRKGWLLFISPFVCCFCSKMRAAERR